MKQKYSYDFFLDQIEEIEEQIGQYEEEAFECEKLRSEIENIENLEDGLRAKYEKSMELSQQRRAVLTPCRS